MNKLDEIKTRINAYRVGCAERNEPWENGPGEDFDWLVTQINEKDHELARKEILLKIADELITNENAKRDWENAKRTRIM